MGLTPGTPLMAMIQESLTYYICRRLQTSAWQHLHFELSGATVKVSYLQTCNRLHLAPTLLPIRRCFPIHREALSAQWALCMQEDAGSVFSL